LSGGCPLALDSVGNKLAIGPFSASHQYRYQ
jgi:hypothetical protein